MNGMDVKRYRILAIDDEQLMLDVYRDVLTLVNRKGNSLEFRYKD